MKWNNKENKENYSSFCEEASQHSMMKLEK